MAVSVHKLLLAVLAIGSVIPAVSRAAEPDLILHSGRVVTVDEHFTIAEAIAVAGDRIVAVGSDDEVLPLKQDTTQVIDLEGRMLLPGLIDSHVHAPAAAMYEFDHEVPVMESIDDVLAYIRDRAAALPEGDWIVLQQVFITRLKEQRYPFRAELDEAAPRHPVVFRTGPDASVNSLALSLSGIDREFAEQHPDRVQRDPVTGEPTGLLRRHSGLLKNKTPASQKQATRQERDDQLARLFADYNRVGITGIIDRNASASAQEQYERLRDQNRLTVRARLSRGLNPSQKLDDVLADLDRIAADPLVTTDDPWLRIIGVKCFLDGGMLTGSAYMTQPWGVSRIYGIDDPDYRGMRYIDDARLRGIVEGCVRRNLAFTAHSVGDGAVAALLDAYAAVDEQIDISPTHSTITHSNFMSADSVRRCAELGIGVDIQPAWLYLDTWTLVAQFGNERLRYFQPLASLFAAGVYAGGGSDHMQKIGPLRSVNPYDPFLGMWTTITRRARWYEEPLHLEEALTRQQAIRFYTRNNAWLMRSEAELGSLEAGKLADMILLDRDLLECPIDELREARVLTTWVGGEVVYDAAVNGPAEAQ